MIQLLKWTKDKPKVPGLYYHRVEDVVQLARVGYNAISDNKLVFSYGANASGQFAYIENTTGEWVNIEKPSIISEDDIETLIQGLMLVTVEQQRIAADAGELLDVFKEAKVQEIEGTKLSDITMIYQNATNSIAHCQRIADTFKTAAGYADNLYALPLASVATLLNKCRDEDS